VNHPFRSAALLAALGAIPLLVCVIVLPGDRSRALDFYLLYLGSALLFVLARMTSAHGGRRPIPPKKERPPEGRLPDLVRIERELVLATGSAFDRQMRVGPLMRDIARHRLWTRRGIDLEEQPEQAHEVLGEEVWRLLRAGRPEPDLRYQPGADIAELRQILERIEKV
jgi:hypothetical protein